VSNEKRVASEADGLRGGKSVYSVSQMLGRGWCRRFRLTGKEGAFFVGIRANHNMNISSWKNYVIPGLYVIQCGVFCWAHLEAVKGGP
jgi:hypothetical protein